MVNQELIGELCAPRELIIPTIKDSQFPMMSGALFLSGAKMWIVVGGKPELVTST